ncbi:MAG TPA: PLP-dependent aminotransferase family protein [Candidatus Tectomicrobia bacterium]
MPTLWTQRYAQRTQRMHRSALDALIRPTEPSAILSFAGGLPAADMFPMTEVQEACQRVLTEHGARALQYGSTQGYRPLREMITRHTARYGITITPDHVLVTSGSQQALDLIGKVFINPGDRVLVEAPTHLGALQAWQSYQAEYVQVPLDAEGIHPDLLEAALRSGPKLLYVLPNFHNPTGVTLSLARRLKLIAQADHYGVPIIEDDPYGQLRYEGEHITPLAVLDGRVHAAADLPYSGNVLYLSTFSQTLAPGLRLGWMIAPTDVMQRLVQAKEAADLQTSLFLQMVAYEVARGGFLDHHVRELRVIYRERRDAMLTALRHFFPPEATWTEPQGGLFVWVTLPPSLDATAVLQDALAAHVAFAPGAAFFAHGGGQHMMRLNFTCMEPDRIEEGIRCLGGVLTHCLGPSA